MATGGRDDDFRGFDSGIGSPPPKQKIQLSSFALLGWPGGATIAQMEEQGYTIIKRLGSGGFGQVWLAKQKKGDLERDAAIKVIELKNLSQDSLEKFIPRETHICKTFKHKNIVPVYDVLEEINMFNKKTRIFIIMEAAKHDLVTDIEIRSQVSIYPEWKMQEITRGIVAGLRFLHYHNVAHRDLKPANILISAEDNRAMLTDFGLSRQMNNQDERAMTFAGTPEYMSPQQIMCAGDLEGDYNPFKGDIWSLGILLYEVFTNELPFYLDRETDPREIVENQLTAQSRIRTLNQRIWKDEDEHYWSEELINLMIQCATFSEDNRPDIDQIAQHEWVALDEELGGEIVSPAQVTEAKVTEEQVKDEVGEDEGNISPAPGDRHKFSLTANKRSRFSKPNLRSDKQHNRRSAPGGFTFTGKSPSPRSESPELALSAIELDEAEEARPSTPIAKGVKCRICGIM